MKRDVSETYNPEFKDSTIQQPDFDSSGVEDGHSDYVSVLVRYDSFKFEKDLGRSSGEFFFDKSSDYYSNILNVSSFDGTSSCYSSFDGFRSLIRSRTFDLSDPTIDSDTTYDDISDEYEISMVPEQNCDICYGFLANESTSRCRRCKVFTHTNCLLNSCNTVTELTPVSNEPTDQTDLSHEPPMNSNFRQKHYEFTCKVCLLKLSPIKKPHCCICNLQGGIINYTEKIYYHPFCVYYSYDVLYPYFNNNMSLSNPMQFKKYIQTHTSNLSPKEKTGLKHCIICTDHLGVTMKCSFPSCNNYLHARCIINSYKDDLNRKSPRNVSETSPQNEGVVIFLVIKYQSNIGNRSVVFKGCFCRSHMKKKYINYTIYKQLINLSILVPKNRTNYNKYKQVIDNILKQYFNKKGYSSSLDDISFTIDTNSKIPTVNAVPVSSTKKRKLNEILGEIKSRVGGDEEGSIVEKVEQRTKENKEEELVIYEHKENKNKENNGDNDNKEENTTNTKEKENNTENKETKDKEKEKEKEEKEEENTTMTENKENTKEKKKEGIIKKDDKDKKDEEELKVQKVLVQKFDIFNPIRFDPFTSHSVVSGVSQTGQGHGSSQKDGQVHREGHNINDTQRQKDTHSYDDDNKNKENKYNKEENTKEKKKKENKDNNNKDEYSQREGYNQNKNQHKDQNKNMNQSMNKYMGQSHDHTSSVSNTGGSSAGYKSSLSEVPKAATPRKYVGKSDSSSLSSVLLYNKENKDNILPLNSILFDNIKTNKELALCYQQQILSSCTGIIEYMNVLNENLFRRYEDENYLYVLFENAIDNYLLIYSFNKKVLSTMNISEFNSQMQLDLKSLLSNSMVKESVLKENAMFNNVNMYGIKDDIKYINSISSTGMVGGALGGTPSFKNRSLCKKLSLVKYIKLNTFELEMLKKSILEMRNMNYIKLIVFNQMTNVHSGHGSNGGFGGMEEKYINYIDWNKIITNIKNMYDNNNNIGTPIKYDEYRLLSHLNQDLKRNGEESMGVKDDFLKNEYGLIDSELNVVNQKLVEIKNKLHENILNYCSNYYLDHEKLLMNKKMLSMYESNEYYYHITHNLSKLFSRSNRLLNLPEMDEMNRKNKRVGGERVYGGKECVYNEFNVEKMMLVRERKEEDEGRYCQICYNEEENNINVLVKCTRCLIVVHKYCYNIPISKIVRNTEYLCNRCEYEKKQLSSQYQSNYKKFSILCNICKRGSGPLSRSKEDWYHPFCYLLVLLVSSPNGFQAKNMSCENVVNIGKIDFNKETKDKENKTKENKQMEEEEKEKEKNNTTNIKEEEKEKEENITKTENKENTKEKEKKKRCVVCYISEGVLIGCSKCSNKFHPYCGYFQGFQFKLVKGSNSTRLKVFCNNHFSLSNAVHVRKISKYNEEIKEVNTTNTKENKEKDEENKETHKEIKDKENKENNKEMDMIMNVIRNRYKRYINRDISDTVYDKDKKKRIIHTSSSMDESQQYKESDEDFEKTCSICFKDDAEICCRGCEKYIHKSCYVVEIKEEFKCDVCSYKEEDNKNKEMDIHCNICLNNEDLLVRSHGNNFFHIICQIFYNCTESSDSGVYYNPDYNKAGILWEYFNINKKIEEINKENNKENEGNKNKTENKENTKEKETGCNICSGEYGFMIYCYKKDCNVKYHPNCAAKHDLVLEPYFTSKGMKYISLCQEHSLLHNAIGQNLKSILKTRLQIMMMQDIFKDMYHQNIIIKSILRKRKEIYNELYPLNGIFNMDSTI